MYEGISAKCAGRQLGILYARRKYGITMWLAAFVDKAAFVSKCSIAVSHDKFDCNTNTAMIYQLQQ